MPSPTQWGKICFLCPRSTSIRVLETWPRKSQVSDAAEEGLGEQSCVLCGFHPPTEPGRSHACMAMPTHLGTIWAMLVQMKDPLSRLECRISGSPAVTSACRRSSRRPPNLNLSVKGTERMFCAVWRMVYGCCTLGFE